MGPKTPDRKEEGIVRWLHDDEVGQRNVPGKVENQRKLEPCTWLRLEARAVIIEIARSVVGKKLDEKAAIEKERGNQVG